MASARERAAFIRPSLTSFLAKRVPDQETFLRQLAVRFTFAKPDFKILIVDTATNGAKPVKVNPLSIPLLPGSRIDLASRPVIADDGSTLPVSGWLGMAKEAYKNEEMMGVRNLCPRQDRGGDARLQSTCRFHWRVRHAVLLGWPS